MYQTKLPTTIDHFETHVTLSTPTFKLSLPYTYYTNKLSSGDLIYEYREEVPVRIIDPDTQEIYWEK